jgi:hypothetical protein
MKLMGIWPPLPIKIANFEWRPSKDKDFKAAMMYTNRVRTIELNIKAFQLQRLASSMQVQFPALKHLTLRCHTFALPLPLPFTYPAPSLPDGFLDGLSPRLQHLELHWISFPALPKLLLSVTELVYLSLSKIPHSGYISPDAIASSLAVLSNLKYLTIEFESPVSRPGRESRRLPPSTRTILPALIHFQFQGVSKYLEDLLAWVEAPFLDSIKVVFFYQRIFDIPQLAQFMGLTTRFQTHNEAQVLLNGHGVHVESLPPFPMTRTSHERSWLRIPCRNIDFQLLSLVQVLTSFFPSIYTVEHLYIRWDRFSTSEWQGNINNMRWIDVLRQFTAVKNLYLSKESAKCIALTLKDLVGERATNVLPALEGLFLEEYQPSGHVQEAIGHFVAARQLLGHPVAVSRWICTV